VLCLDHDAADMIISRSREYIERRIRTHRHRTGE
jgi:hypothetical protein